MVRPALILMALLAAQGMAYFAISRRTEATPVVKPLAAFPVQTGNWRMTGEGTLDQDEKDALRADDYLTREYATPAGNTASLFIAYFHSQRAGQTPHSPKNCLPGAGWTWSVADTVRVPVGARDRPIEINRYAVSKGDERAVVLYWYQSRDRVMASEYRAAFFTAWDAIRYNRTDTELVRVVAPAAREGVDFIRAFFGELRRYNQK